MLVLTRRPGESIRIGEDIEVLVVDVDWQDLETRCAIRASDAQGNDVDLKLVRTRSGIPRVEVSR